MLVIPQVSIQLTFKHFLDAPLLQLAKKVIERVTALELL